MASRIEDYALIGDTHTAALVSRGGAIDWLCLPRFDSGAVFAALLGTAEHGRWLLAPQGRVLSAEHRYRGDTLVVDTDMVTADGAIRLTDLMPHRHRYADVVRIVEGLRGRVAMRMELVMRFDDGSVVPWVRRTEQGLSAIAGPNALVLRADVPLRGENLTTVADFTVSAGERIPFVLTWHRSYEPPPPPLDAHEVLAQTLRWWTVWSARGTYRGPWSEAVRRSLITLKALTYEPTGGIVAAPTTSLPEVIGGVRNWDYRYCWLRDATLTLHALMTAGYDEEARAWREWLLRAVAGDPARLQIMYGARGERRLTEREIEWLPGYEGSSPVRVGNAAAGQLQLDVYGEVLDALHHARCIGIEPEESAWALQRALLDFLEGNWEKPDEGIWEVRGQRRHFTHSKVMAWVAIDRAVKAVEHFGLDGPVDRWRRLRSAIHHDVCTRAYDTSRQTFTQSYGSAELDASLLLIPQVGFLPPGDPRVIGTVDAVRRGLCRDGLVMRYDTTSAGDGLPPGEGAFLAASFWLVDALALIGRAGDARRSFEQLLSLRNDVGLLAEEYDVAQRRQLGNFPQAFSHVALINSAFTLAGVGAAARRAAVELTVEPTRSDADAVVANTDVAS